MGVAFNGTANVQRATIASITICHDRDRDLTNSLLDLVAHLCHGDVTSIRETIRAGNRVPSKENHWESCLFNKSRRKAVVAASMGKNLGRVLMSFKHHCSETA